MRWQTVWAGLLPALLLLAGLAAAAAQPLDLTQGGPLTVTARDGLEWHQAEQEVIARGDARAVRQNVTVTADRLIAYYRKKAGSGASTPGTSTPGTSTPGTSTPGTSTPGTSTPSASSPTTATASAQPGAMKSGTAQSNIAADTDTSGTEIYRLRAEGNVQIFTATDHAWGDVAVYDIDQAVMVMTGHDLRLTTPNDLLTARDTLEYWPQKHMAVARGNAAVLTKDARRVAADVLVAYTADTSASGSASAAAKPPPKPGAASTPPGSGDDLASSGKLEKVEAFGHVSIRTPTDTATGDRAVYVPDSGIARLAGNVRITRGQNQLNGQEAEVDMKTGISRLLRGNTERVSGLVVPNDTTNRAVGNLTQPPGAATPSGGAPTTGTQTGNPTGGTPAAGTQVGGHP